MSVKFKLGGTEYEVHPLPFARLKKMWPHVNGAMNGMANVTNREEAIEVGFEAITAVSHLLSVMLIKQNPELTPEEVEERLLPSEIPDVSAAIQKLMIESGLVSGSPQLPAGLDAILNGSTVTSTQSSPSLSPQDAKGAAGT